MTSPSTMVASEILSQAARNGNEFLWSQINQKAVLFSELKKTKATGQLGIVNIMAGGQASVTQIADGGDLPAGSTAQQVQGTVAPVSYYASLSLGRQAVNTLAGVEDSVDLVMKQMQSMASDLARQLDRALYGNQLSASTTASGVWALNSDGIAAVSVTFDGGLSDFRVGEAYQWKDVPNGRVYDIYCEDVFPVDVDTVQVSFTNEVPGIAGLGDQEQNDLVGLAIGTDDQFFLRGTFVGGGGAGSAVEINAAPVNLSQITSTTLSLHGLPARSNGWTGNTLSGTGPAFTERFFTASALVQGISDEEPDLLIINTQVMPAVAAGALTAGTAFGMGTNQVGQSRRNLQGKLDKYGAGDGSNLAILGKPVLVDPNCPQGDAYFISKDFIDLLEWRKPSPEKDDGGPVLLNRSKFTYDIQYSCIYNMRCVKRNAHIRLAGITLT